MNGLSVKQRVGMRVRAARKAAGMTQEQVAERIGLTRPSLANLEAGNQDITVTRLAMLAEVLHLDLGDLVREEDLHAPSPLPRDVAIRHVWEVTCETCGGLVIDVHPDRRRAVRSKRDHIEAKRAEAA